MFDIKAYKNTRFEDNIVGPHARESRNFSIMKEGGLKNGVKS